MCSSDTSQLVVPLRVGEPRLSRQVRQFLLHFPLSLSAATRRAILGTPPTVVSIQKSTRRKKNCSLAAVARRKLVAPTPTGSNTTGLPFWFACLPAASIPSSASTVP